MRSSRFAVAATAFLILLTACQSNAGNAPAANTSNTAAGPTASPSPSPSAIDQMAAARENYAQRCETCHGQTAAGGIVPTKKGKLKVPSLREGHAMRHSDAEYMKQIRQGGGGMPAFKDEMSESEMADLVRYIRSEFQKGTAPSPSP